MYRDFSKQMIMGNKDYFVAQIDCDLVMKPTIMNIPTTPALTREMIESDMRSNPEKHVESIIVNLQLTQVRMQL